MKSDLQASTVTEALLVEAGLAAQATVALEESSLQYFSALKAISGLSKGKELYHVALFGVFTRVDGVHG